MALDPNINSLEKLKFVEDSGGKTAVRVVGELSTAVESLNVVQAKGVVGTSPQSLPSTALGEVHDAFIRCSNDQAMTNRLLVSFDGSTFEELSPGEFIIWPLKGTGKTQVTIQGNVAGVKYGAVFNRVAP